MRHFFYFIISHITVLIFLLLELVCFMLIVNYNDYHKASFFNTSNAVSGAMLDAKMSVVDYFSLGDANRRLVAENARLRTRLAHYTHIIDRDTTGLNIPLTGAKYIFRGARVINSSVSKSRNYITLDAGADDGIRADMAVVGHKGVVGLVMADSDHYSTVIPLVNTNFHLSARISRTNFFGSLEWDGMSPQYSTLNEIPEHADVAVGDSVVTSGFSDFFPQGMLIGFVSKVEQDANEGFYMLEVRLAEDFSRLYYVSVVENTQADEQIQIENSTYND